MAFFTSQQLFGDGSGVPGDPGWVPIETSAPPAFSVNNRGVAFGEQLSSAIANRPHYALALNDDDLNARLALFETGGLDAAYDQGALAVNGGGRVITKDGGAVETVSTLSTMYGDDVANAHFRADARADASQGGGGYEFVGGAALYGLMDRRGYEFANNTVIADDATAVLNSGGAAADGITLSAGVYRTSANTDLILGVDMIEVLSGAHAGLYVITALPTTTRATVRTLSGSTPSFAANTATTIRIYRPTFGSFSELGHTGTLALNGTMFSGLPGQDSAAIIVPGAYNGRYGDLADGAPYALKVMGRTAAGALTPAAHIDGTGQFRSYASVVDLTDAERLAGVDYGNAAFYSRQDENDSNAEVGFLSRSTGGSNQQLAFVASSDCRTPANPAGTFSFNFINSGGSNVDIADVNMADWFMAAGITFVEIMTPSEHAGIYLVSARDTNSGELTLTAINGAAVSFPTSGAGTMRALRTSVIGQREVDLGFSPWADTECVAAAVLESPPGTDDAALVLVGSMQDDQALIRGVGIEDGTQSENFRVTPAGTVLAHGQVHASLGFEVTGAAGEFAYSAPRTGRRFCVNMSDGRPMTDNTGASPEWYFQTGPASIAPLWGSLSNSGEIVFPLNAYLRDGMIITDVRLVVDVGEARSGNNRVRLGLLYERPDFAAPANNPVTPAVVGGTFTYDNAASGKQVLSLATVLGVGHTVERNAAVGRAYFVHVQAGATGAANRDTLYGLEIVYSDPGPRNF